MSGAITPYLSQLWLNQIVNGAIATYAGLHYAAPPVDNPTSTEVSGGTYHRIAVSWTLSNTSINASNTLLWSGLNPIAVTHIGVYDAAYNGNLLMKIELSAPVVLGNNASYEISPGEIYLSLT